MAGSEQWVTRNAWGYPDWSLRVSDDHAHRRACGRRRYNAQRRQQRYERRERVLAAMAKGGPGLAFIEHGWQARMARELGVDRATVCRDVDALLGEIFGTGNVAGTDFEIRITCGFLRALIPTPAELRLYRKLGLSTISSHRG